MTQDFAALLAQVIPVVAIGAGLELRAMSARFKKEYRGDEVQRMSVVVVLGLPALGAALILAILGPAEVAVLARAAGTNLEAALKTALAMGIIFVFGIPVVEFLGVVIPVMLNQKRQETIRTWWALALIAYLFAESLLAVAIRV